jgi:DtxR family transcriptional regulator, Mn-dependent transcriptional regulator
MRVSPQLSASLEDYLEAIFHVIEDKQAARAKDIVERLGVHNSSVTQALRALSERGLVNYAPYDLVTLTEAGRTAAAEVVEKHQACDPS